MVSGVGTLVDLLRWRAGTLEGDRGYTFLLDGERAEVSITYQDLDIHARAIAALLQQRGHQGGRVLLLYPSGLQFITAFFGCLYARAVAVPAPLPENERATARLSNLMADARPTAVLSLASVTDTLRSTFSAASGDRQPEWMATDDVPLSLSIDWREPACEESDVAFLQYTSGATSDPRGVEVTHGNIVANQRAIAAAFQHDVESPVVGWLPLYHDMGLIGNVMHPLYVGSSCVLLSPEAFLQQPLRWLRAIDRYRGTTSGGPNFAYDLCARKATVAETQRLDLSCWRIAFNGSEPVQARTLERFAATFAPAGFRSDAWLPCYGLAESTLLVSGGPRGGGASARSYAFAPDGSVSVADGIDGASQSRPIVSCGESCDDQRLVIADADGRRCPDRMVGEIWLSGPSVARGYWQRPTETQQTFEAVLSTGEGPFLRTGDLGFRDGRDLFVTGRCKDVILLRGANYYPQDIEQAAVSASPRLRAGGAAAFGVDGDGRERVVLAHEVAQVDSQEAERVVERIRHHVLEATRVALDCVVLLEAGTIARTPNGKIQRQACRTAFMNNALSIVHRWETALEA